jgi:hypothetical protein
MKPRPAGLAIGLVVAVVGLPVTWFVSACLGLPLTVVGVLMMANERGQRRFRVTRTKLLIEDEPLIRGFVIGPIRNRIPWEDVQSVEQEGSGVNLVTKDGTVHRLAEGGTEQELERFLGRLRVSMGD